MFHIILFSLFLFCAPAYAEPRLVPETPQDIQLSFAPLVKRVAPSVVNIYTKRTVTQSVSPFAGNPLFEQFFGNDPRFSVKRKGVENSLGSGVIASADGMILTNAHVIKGAEEIVVILSDGTEYAARTRIMDEKTDLAVLKIEAEKGKTFPAVTLQPSESLQVGDLVLAIGNPFGVGQTVTSGIVSALARSNLDISDFNFFIQTDAAINPGNSGGPLVSMKGGVVGINSAIYSRDGGSLGIGFAVPSEIAATVLAAAQKGDVKSVVRPWIGVSAEAVTAATAKKLKLPNRDGTLITALHPASPLAEAGAQIGDIVLAMNDKPVRDPAMLRYMLSTLPIGGKVRMAVFRDGRTINLEMPLIAPPDMPPARKTTLRNKTPFNGITVANLNPALMEELDLNTGGQIDLTGVVVLDVRTRFPQINALIRPGDIVVEAAGKPVKTIEDFSATLESGNAERSWHLSVMRNGQIRDLVFQ